MSTETIEEAPGAATSAGRSTTAAVADARDLGPAIRRICAASHATEECFQRLVRLWTGQPDVVAATLFHCADGAACRPVAPLCLPEPSQIVKAWDAPLRESAQTTATSSAVRLIALRGATTEYFGVLAPVVRDERVQCIVCLVGITHPDTMAKLSLMAQLAAAELALILAAPRGLASGRVPETDGLLRTALQTAANGDIADGYHNVANQLRDEMGCLSVLVGTRSRFRRTCLLRAISGVRHLRRHTPLVTCAEEVLTEATLRDRVECHDAASPAPNATDAQRQLAHLCRARTIVSGPVRNHRDKVVGAWAILYDEKQSASIRNETLRVRPFADHLSSRLGPCLAVLQRFRPTPVERIARRVTGPKAGRWRRILLPVGVALACLMALPLPYRVKCDGEVQAVTRRFVPVPYDGVLQEVLVEPGDVVHKGQVLARMDSRETNWELEAQRAEYRRAKKQHDVELAEQDASAAQVAQLEMERLSQQIKLLQNRAVNLEVCSPIDGVVIGGDPKKIEHARLTMGETLFEIGPLEKMVVDVFVPDEEIAWVKEGQEVTIRLDALPGSPRTGTIRRMSPQAEPRRQENVFVAEVDLENRDRVLRPGMMGRCRIRTVVRPLVWNLFHRAWESLVYHLAW